MFDNDNIQRFLLNDSNVRGEVIHLEKVIQKLFEKHNYPSAVKQLLIEALLCSVLMTSTLKFKGQLTVQFQSDKAISLLLIKCNNLFQVRALAQFTEDLSEAEYLASLENGSLSITIESSNAVKPYQSIVELKSSIKESIEFYFFQSEQLPTKFYLSATPTHASGLMLQQMPSNESITPEPEKSWQHVTALANTITYEELLNLDNETLLYRLFHEEQCHLFQAYQVQYKCPCSKPRMLETIKLVGEADAMDLLAVNKAIQIKCEFCLENYAFEKNDILYLFQNQ